MKKIPKIKHISLSYLNPKSKDILWFPLVDLIMKPNGQEDKKLVDKLNSSGVLKMMAKNLKGNYKKRVRRYRILLDNHDWIDGHVVGRDK